MRVLLDTNMFLDAVKFRVDIVAEAQKFGVPFTLKSCIRELEGISNGGGKDAAQAKMALQLARLPAEKSRGPADKAILDYAVKNDCSVATNDENLIKALRTKGIRVVRLRQKRYLAEA